MAVSRATRNIYEDSIKWFSDGEKRSLESFSNKQCAAQYEHLLKTVPTRRKKRSERASDQGNVTESPAEILQQTCRHEFMEELKKSALEVQAQYLKLKKECEDIQARKLDHKLEEILEEYEAKEREKEIKLRLKFKLGEKSMAEAPTSVDQERPPPPVELPTTPVKSEKDAGPEPHKTTVTTSPLLTSLLQSPSPLTRPSSATPTISLILNSSPPVPSNESPTLSKLLESSYPTPATPSSSQLSNATSARSLMSTSTPQPSRPMSTQSTPLTALVEQPVATPAPPRPIVSPVVSIPPPIVKVEPSPQKPEVPPPESLAQPAIMDVEEEVLTNDEVVEQTQLNKTESTQEDLDKLAKAPEPDKPESCSPSFVEVEDKKRGLPRRLILDNLEPEEVDTTESQVIETVEEIIEKVQTAIIETVVESSGSEESVQEVKDVPTNEKVKETPNVDDHSLDTLELTTDAVEMIVMGPDQPPCVELNRTPDSNKPEESKEENTEDVPDIDEIQPSISASDVVDLEEPLKEPISGGKEGLDEKSPQAASIEQAEADLAAMAQEEEDAASEPPIDLEKLIDKEVVVVVNRVADEWVDREMSRDKSVKNTEELEDDEDDEQEEETVKEVEKEAETQKEEIEEAPVSEKEKVEEFKNDEPVVEAKDPEESEDKSVDESQTKEDVFDEEDDAQESKSESSRPPIEVEEVTTGTENTSDSFVTDKGKEVEDDVKEERSTEKGDEPKEIIDKEVKKVPTIVREEPPEKAKPKTGTGDKSTKTTDAKREESLEEKVEEIRTGKRELRRGRATPPVTSSPAASASAPAERVLREKRPSTPSGTSEVKDEPVTRPKRKRTTNWSESSVPCSPSASITSNDDDKDYRVWKKLVLLAYDRIAAHKYASVFLKPINENDAPGYFQIIKCPTDLTTIKRQIESGLIRTTVDFQKEIILMISNAIIYNKSDTLVHKMANEMLPDMKEAMETMVHALGSGVLLDQPDSRPPVTSRVSRASVSAKGLGSDDSSGTPSTSVQNSGKRKRQQLPVEEARSKRKRSDAS